MLIQLQPQHLTVLKLKLELFPVEPRIVLVDNPMVVWADNNDVRRVVVLRTGEVVHVLKGQQRQVHRLDLRSSLLSLGIIGTSSILLSLNCSLHTLFMVCSYSLLPFFYLRTIS